MKSEYMDLAFALARQGVGRTSPNPAVGAVLVRDGAVVGVGFHTLNGISHAEVKALRDAGERARGATVYVTLEPCSHQGRTGPCADELIRAGVSKVVAAMVDPNPMVSGQGLERLRAAGIEVELAPEYEEAAMQLNEAFVHAMRTGRPLVTMKAALTLDGKIGAARGDTGWITSEQARAHAQTLRHASDAIVTGIGTVLADDPLLTDRTGEERSRPLFRVVLDSKLRIPLDSRLVRSVGDDLLVFTTPPADESRVEALQRRGVRVLVSDGGFPELLKSLSVREFRSLLIEAGATVNAAALEAGIVDKIFFYYAPKILGGLSLLPVVGGEGRTRDNPIRIERVTIHTIAPDEFAVEGYVHRDR
jgi:diaminohydroxyphosphoribosylaminopyrimidine deaminase/5-amino-6-(5-phosphoribosylamino)uracil reductase